MGRLHALVIVATATALVLGRGGGLLGAQTTTTADGGVTTTTVEESRVVMEIDTSVPFVIRPDSGVAVTFTVVGADALCRLPFLNFALVGVGIDQLASTGAVAKVSVDATCTPAAQTWTVVVNPLHDPPFGYPPLPFEPGPAELQGFVTPPGGPNRDIALTDALPVVLLASPRPPPTAAVANAPSVSPAFTG